MTNKNSRIRVGRYEGKYFLIGSDGYSTTQKMWKYKEEAENALKREQKLEDYGKPSRMIWIY